MATVDRAKLFALVFCTLTCQIEMNGFFFSVELRPNDGHSLLILEVF